MQDVLLGALVVVMITITLELLSHYAIRDHLGPNFEELDPWWREAIGVIWLLLPASLWVAVARPSALAVMVTIWAGAVTSGAALKLAEGARKEKAIKGERQVRETLREQR